MRDRRAWLPVAVLVAGLLLLAGIREPRAMALRAPLATLPPSIAGLTGEPRTLPPEELAVNGAHDYLLRVYRDGDGEERMGLYVGYYERQGQGRGAHSPKNCLPGSGWSPLSATIRTVSSGDTQASVNRYLIASATERALVYYWYQGRGRVEASEYRVKWNLLRDAALEGRSDEALVRLVVPLRPGQSEADADSLATASLRTLLPAVAAVMPL